MFSDEEMAVLNRLAKDIFGCRYNDLDYEDRDFVYCYAEDHGMM